MKQIDTYTPEEFAKNCSQRGYCAKVTAERYARRAGDRPLTEEDMIEAYRAEEVRKRAYDIQVRRSGGIRTTRIWREDEE